MDRGKAQEMKFITRGIDGKLYEVTVKGQDSALSHITKRIERLLDEEEASKGQYVRPVQGSDSDLVSAGDDSSEDVRETRGILQYRNPRQLHSKAQLENETHSTVQTEV